MKLEEIAALGSDREPGESLGSWLRAGPLGPAVLSYFPELRTVEIDSEDAVASCTICPRCWVHEHGCRRLYARTEWSDPRMVVCIEHAQPLQSVKPTLLSARLAHSRSTREFRMIAKWITRWQAQSPCSSTRHLVMSRSCVEDVMLDALTKIRVATVASTWQWRLWVDGWPVPPCPRSLPQFQLVDMPRLADRLALVCTVWRICRLLRGEIAPHWPPVRVAEEEYAQLENSISRFEPRLADRLGLVLRQRGKSASRMSRL